MIGHLNLEGYIIIPFGIDSEIEVTFSLANTCQTGTDIIPDIPCVLIDLEQYQCIRFSDIRGIFCDPFPFTEDGKEAFKFVREFIFRKYLGLTPNQVDFLNLYFNFCTSIGEDLRYQPTETKETVLSNYDWPFEAALPMANAHLYLGPEKDPGTGVSDKIVADILFWTGKRFVAVELVREKDLRKHLKRIRTFLANNIEPVIIFEKELKKDRENSLCRHLPPEILNFWLHCTGEPLNPLSLPF